MWYHLYNDDDNVFTAEQRLQSDRFAQILTHFDKPNDILNHDPIFYFNHANTQARVWFDVASARSRALAREARLTRAVMTPPDRRALLIGINEYANLANRLEGAKEEVDRFDECLVPYDFDWSPQHAVTTTSSSSSIASFPTAPASRRSSTAATPADYARRRAARPRHQPAG